MKKLVLAFVISTLFGSAVQASSCDQESIKTKADDGSILVLTDGSVWEVNEVDRVDSAVWVVR